jgi:hypothetical protein
VKLSSASGKGVLALQTTEAGDGGEVVVRGPQDGQVARLGENNGDMALRFYTGAALLSGIGENPGGGILQIDDKAGKVTTKVSNAIHGGAVEVFGSDQQSSSEQPKLLMAINDAKRGEIDIRNDSGGPAVTLRATADAGYFALTNAADMPRVEAGVEHGDRGIVRAYGPGGFDYIRGVIK